MGRHRKPRPSLRLFSAAMTLADAKALLERLGGIDPRARLHEERSRDRHGELSYSKWVARYGNKRWSVRRELVADVTRALAMAAADDLERKAAELRKAVEEPIRATGTRGPPK